MYREKPEKMREAEEKGFTLIEILLAVVVLSVGILGLAALQISAFKGNAAAMKMTDGVAWATEQAEILMSADYTDTMLDIGDHSPIHRGANNKYAISWNVADTGNNTKKITITVNWSEGTGGHSTSVDFLKPQDM